MKGARKARMHTPEFKLRVVQRRMAGEPLVKLSRELKIKRTLLYRWRDAYRKQGIEGFQRPQGRPREELPAAEARVRDLEPRRSEAIPNSKSQM